MIWFILAAIFAVTAVITGFIASTYNTDRAEAQADLDEMGSADRNARWRESEKYQDRIVRGRSYSRNYRALSFVALGLAAIALFLSVFTIVQPRSVGVPKTFGTIGEPMKPGPSFKSPFTKVIEVPTVEQIDNWNGGDDDDDHDKITVQLGDGSFAKATVSLAWNNNGDKAKEVYTTYRDDDPTELVYQRIVSPRIKQSAQEVLGKYNPTEPVTETATKVSFTPNFEALSEEIKKNFQAAVDQRGEYIEIVDVTFSRLDLDADANKQVKKLRAEFLKTMQAEQSVKTAEAQAKANKILADSLNKTQGGAEIYCLSLIEQGKLNPPVGFSCSGAGNDNLILPSR